jgi:ketosteroid isomerase-like protein
MRTSVLCPSDLALELYLLGELAPRQPGVGDHIASCETCRTKIADKAVHSVDFAISPGAAEIKRSLALPASAPRAPTPFAETGGSRRRVLAAVGFAAAVALAFLLTLRPPSSVPSSPAPAQSAHSSEDEEKVVLGVQRQWMEAIRDKDAAALDRILADDYVNTDSRGGVTNKADSLRQARAGGDHMKAFYTSDEKARVYGDVAIITGRLRVEGIASGQPYDAEVRFTDILARIDGQWRAVAAHASKPLERRTPSP